MNLLKVRYLLTLSVALLLCGCDSGQKGKSDSTKPGEMRVVAILPLTGALAKYGEAAKAGMELAESHFKSSNPDVQFHIDYVDDKGEAATSLSVFEQALLRDRPVAILGPIPSGITRALLPKLEANKIVAITPTSTSPNLRGASPYLFRTCVSDDMEAMSVAEYAAKKLSRPDIAVLYINNEYGKSLKEVFAAKYSQLGGKVIFDEAYAPETRDFRAVLAKPGVKGARTIFIIGQDEQAQLISQIGERGIKSSILGTTMFEDSKILALPNSDGISFSYRSFDPERASEIVKRFVADYRKNHSSQQPNFFAASSYDAASVLLQALKYKHSHPQSTLADALHVMPPLEGVNGSLRFDEKNDVMQRFGMKIIRSGVYEWIDRPF